MSANKAVEGKTSWAWWLLPICLSWLGGLVAYYEFEKKDRRKAKNMLILGIVVFMAWVTYWITRIFLLPM